MKFHDCHFTFQRTQPPPPSPQPLWVICRTAELAFRFAVDNSACPAISITVSKLSSIHHHLNICGCQGEPLEHEGDGSRSVPDQGCKPNVQDFHWKHGRSCWVVFHCDKISYHMPLYVFDKHNINILETLFIKCLITWRKWSWLQVFTLRVGHYTHRLSSGKRPWTQTVCSVQISGSLLYLTHIVGKFLSSTLSYTFGRHVEPPKPICRTEVLTCL
jgi:hypothetical protein